MCRRSRFLVNRRVGVEEDSGSEAGCFWSSSFFEVVVIVQVAVAGVGFVLILTVQSLPGI